MTQMKTAEDWLRRMILEMEIGPGDALTERWVEAQLGVSRATVRTALFRLELAGLVQRRGRGWSVPPIDVDEMAQLFVYRELLETGAVRLGGPGATEADLAAIAAPIDALPADAGADEVEAAGRAFHLALAQLSRNAFVTRAVADAMLRQQRARWVEADSDAGHRGWDEHRAILAALRSGEVERAATLTGAHIRATGARLIAVLNAQPRSLRARGIAVTSR